MTARVYKHKTVRCLSLTKISILSGALPPIVEDALEKSHNEWILRGFTSSYSIYGAA